MEWSGLLILAGIVVIIFKLFSNKINHAKYKLSPAFKAFANKHDFKIKINNYPRRNSLIKETDDYILTIRIDDQENPQGISYSEIYIQMNFKNPAVSLLYITMDKSFKRFREKMKFPVIKLGNSEFDNRALVLGRDEDEIRALLHPFIITFLKNCISKSIGNSFSFVNGKLAAHLKINNEETYKGIDHIIANILKMNMLLNRNISATEMLAENYKSSSLIEERNAYLESYCILQEKISKEDQIIDNALNSNNHQLIFTAVNYLDDSKFYILNEIFIKSSNTIKIKIIEFFIDRNIQNLTFSHEKITEYHKTVKTAFIKYLIKFKNTKYEKTISNELGRNSDVSLEYKNLCIKALGECGTYPSIQLLDNLRTKYAEAAITNAISRIQNRIGSGDDGWLSMKNIDDESGELSITDK